MSNECIYKVAINAPLPALFDYLPPVQGDPVLPGCRVRVPFGRRRQVGMVMASQPTSSLASGRLRRIEKVIDNRPVMDAGQLELIVFAAEYYHHPIGEVVAAALPRPLRDGQPARAQHRGYRLSAAGLAADDASFARAPRQAEMMTLLRAHPEGIDCRSVARHAALADAARRLGKKGLIEIFVEHDADAADFAASEVRAGPVLTPNQSEAVGAINEAEGFHPFLLFGVTGSGKTEVYLRAIEQTLRAGRQSLVLVPEIALTPQLVARFERRFAAPMAVLHSGLPAGARLAGWRAAREGSAAVVIGTRSAVFTPLARPGLFVIDEEHDSSFKQQEGFRYSARDLAVIRARRAGVSIVLGSATPSLESLNNVARGRYRRLDLPHRPGRGRPPRLRLIDLRAEPVNQGLSTALNLAIARHLQDGGQVMLFLNRRGFAPTWFCSGCGALADCRRCDAHLTYHQRDHRLRCHHCGAECAPPETCAECDQPLKPVGQGTERIEEVLTRQFPDARVDRLDRDATRRRGALEAVLARMDTKATDILVGTQMLTKGHHFPDVSLVGIVNADQGLFGTDFRATERLAQMIVQVCGRAGRADRPGEVLIQTSFPDHPLLNTLISDGYEAFAQSALVERRDAGWPPFSFLALLRARGATAGAPLNFLADAATAAAALAGNKGVRILGPAAAPMARRAGQYHAQLLLQSASRGTLNALLRGLGDSLEPAARRHRARWSIDVDPADLF